MKTFIIIKREFLTRVRKKTFILMTVLIPLLLAGSAVLIGYLSSMSASNKLIAVNDESGYFQNELTTQKSITYEFLHEDTEVLRTQVNEGKYDGVLFIPEFEKNEQIRLELYSVEQLGLEIESQIQNQLNDILINERLQEAGILAQDLKEIEKKSISIRALNRAGQEADNISSFVIGYASGIILYFFMLFYGMNVMRSVMEEKTNRIAEIIVSSVTPFQLMLGKIIGVALVGLTQFLIWIALLLIAGAALSGGAMGLLTDPQMTEQLAAAGTDSDLQNNIMSILTGTNWVYILLWFLFYFLGGYFLYAALYAAVGSLVNEDPQDSQQFTLPITLPIILGFVIMSSAIRDPNSSLALFGSLFPMTSPIVMMARIPFGVPTWQLITSAVLLVLGFIFATWMAARIYRTGILLYGKKITFKEVGKWIIKK